MTVNMLTFKVCDCNPCRGRGWSLMMRVPFIGNINLRPGRAGVKFLGRAWPKFSEQAWGARGDGGPGSREGVAPTRWRHTQNDFLNRLLHSPHPSLSSDSPGNHSSLRPSAISPYALSEALTLAVPMSFPALLPYFSWGAIWSNLSFIIHLSDPTTREPAWQAEN